MEFDKFKFLIYDIIAVIAFFVLICLMHTNGPKNVCKKLFFIFSLHWLLKMIISCRQGQIIRILNEPFKKLVDNDEDIANAIGDEENSADKSHGTKNL